ncbi:unnamed protein product, partial [Effrenium voratum]
MNARSNSTSSLTQPRRKRFVPLNDPNAFAKGWAVHPVARTGARHAIGREGLTGKGDRRTWVDAVMRSKIWVPGPGAHATERTFVGEGNEFDAKKCAEEARPDYSFGKAVWEPSLSQA